MFYYKLSSKCPRNGTWITIKRDGKREKLFINKSDIVESNDEDGSLDRAVKSGFLVKLTKNGKGEMVQVQLSDVPQRVVGGNRTVTVSTGRSALTVQKTPNEFAESTGQSSIFNLKYTAVDIDGNPDVDGQQAFEQVSVAVSMPAPVMATIGGEPDMQSIASPAEVAALVAGPTFESTASTNSVQFITNESKTGFIHEPEQVPVVGFSESSQAQFTPFPDNMDDWRKSRWIKEAELRGIRLSEIEVRIPKPDLVALIRGRV